MGTRSTTQIQIDGVPLITIYNQFDGYLAGVGREILLVLKRNHVNGYRNEFEEYNGPGNFASLLITTFMLPRIESAGIRCGGCYIVSNDSHDEGHKYTINFLNLDDLNTEDPQIKVEIYGESTEWLTVQEFENLIKKDAEDD